MTELLPFSGAAYLCVKCGHREADYRWVPGTNGAFDAATEKPEYMIRTCLRCGVSRCEETLEGPPAEVITCACCGNEVCTPQNPGYSSRATGDAWCGQCFNRCELSGTGTHVTQEGQ